MDLDFTTECPECGAPVKASIGAVAKGQTVRCSRGHRIAMEDKDGGARKAQRSLNRMERAFKKIGRIR
ncbi:hypothetical protein [Microlunatus sp. GCM10028923]|uniref:hypothetical protein n=1 Tax=Microlunatus sp. GCM10028923 TaxID=3273400 RepID=UPI0036177BD0